MRAWQHSGSHVACKMHTAVAFKFDVHQYSSIAEANAVLLMDALRLQILCLLRRCFTIGALMTP